jgi:hypothetical protein
VLPPSLQCGNQLKELMMKAIQQHEIETVSGGRMVWRPMPSFPGYVAKPWDGVWEEEFAELDFVKPEPEEPKPKPGTHYL